MKMRIVFFSFILAVSAAGCGGSSNNSVTQSPPPPPPVGGIGRTGFAIGPVANFGSIVVNGVHYDTAGATFTNDDNPAAETDLKVGHMVLVQGTIDDNLTTGTADSVAFDDAVKGPVDSIDLSLSQLVVLGQTILVRPSTSFDDNISPASLDGLTVADIVEVYGFFTATGEIEATRIEKKPLGTQFEVHGTVSNHSAANFMFSINNLNVDYTSALLDNFPGGQISDGDFVEAKGMNLGAAGELLATKIELEGAGITGEEGAHVEVEGFITRFVSDMDFDVAGIAVTTTGATIYEGGVAADLGLNVKVEVEGDLDANDVLVADEVDIRRGKVIRATATVDSVDVGTDTLVMLGFSVSTDALTRFEDKSSADVRPLTIADINAGDYLEVRGGESPTGSGQILATIIERDDVDSRTILQGFVTNVADPTLTIMGVTIETNGAIFRDVDDSILTPGE
ncbi:MAG: hypothetical protein DRR11_19550, partial [Gammaproteobacteria bacterium]